VNVSGSEKADTAAKSALSLPITNVKLPACELTRCISKFCHEERQDIWTAARVINSKLSTPLSALYW